MNRWGAHSLVRERFLGLFATTHRSAIANAFYASVRDGADSPDEVLETVLRIATERTWDVALWLERSEVIVANRRLALAFAAFALGRERSDPGLLDRRRQEAAATRARHEREALAIEARRIEDARSRQSPAGPVAIETAYRGYRFRSRLEARWAVFLDALGARWEFEREGFALPSGARYLPDFWVCWTGATRTGGERRVTAWLEAKGESNVYDYCRWAEFASLIGHRDAVDAYYLVGPLPERSLPELAFYPFPRPASEGQQWIVHHEGGFFNSETAPHLFDWLDSRIITNAGGPNPYSVARSARFEHGARGSTNLVSGTG